MKKKIRTKMEIHNKVVEVINLIREEQNEHYHKKMERLHTLEDILKDVIQYGRLYHHRKKQLKEMGFSIKKE